MWISAGIVLPPHCLKYCVIGQSLLTSISNKKFLPHSVDVICFSRHSLVSVVREDFKGPKSKSHGIMK